MSKNIQGSSYPLLYYTISLFSGMLAEKSYSGIYTSIYTDIYNKLKFLHHINFNIQSWKATLVTVVFVDRQLLFVSHLFQYTNEYHAIIRQKSSDNNHFSKTN